MTVFLYNKELWEKFKEHQTEMIISKEGRRMHPAISLGFQDLNPEKKYAVTIDFVCLDEYKYCFDYSSNRWTPWRESKPEEDASRSIMCLHPETPTTGAILMGRLLTFQRLKLTNSYQTASKTFQVLLLNTMRRYIPRIHLIESTDGSNFDFNMKKEFCFPETEFMAVSAYRNKQIIKLKIDSNPFASAYRNSGLHGKAKRRRKECGNGGVDEGETGSNDNSSNGNDSSVEDNLSDNREDNNFEDNIRSNEHSSLEAPDPLQRYDEQQLNDMQAVLPFLKDRLRREVSFFVYNPASNRGYDRTRQTDQQTVNHVNTKNENESQLACKGSTKWKTKQIDHDGSESKCTELQGILFNERVQPGNATKHDNEICDAGNAAKIEDEMGVAIKERKNRRKKYLPRKVQRASDFSVTADSFKNKVKSSEMQAEEGCSTNGDAVSLDLRDVTCCRQGKSLGSFDCMTSSREQTEDASSALKESLNNQDEDHREASNQDQNSVLVRFQEVVGLQVDSQSKATELGIKEPKHDNPLPTQKDIGVELSSVSTTASLPQEKVDSSLNALIKMCSNAEQSLNDTSYHSWSEEEHDMLCRKSSVQWPALSQVSEQTTSMIHFSEFIPPPNKQRNECPRGVFSAEAAFISENKNRSNLGSEVYGTLFSPSPLSPSSTENNATFLSHNSSTLQVTKPASSAVKGSRGVHFQREENDSTTTIRQFQTTCSEELEEVSRNINLTIATPGPGYVNKFNDKRPLEYRPIALAPNQPKGTRIRQLEDGGSCNDISPHPVIVNVFSLNENAQVVAAGKESVKASSSYPHFSISQNSHLSLGNEKYFLTLNSNEKDHYRCSAGLISLDNTVPKQAPLEKFYSFSTLKPESKQQSECPRPRLHGKRHYKTTRTNFSRLSLEPLCSVIYPLKHS